MNPIVEKIKKLFALANKASNSNEAEASAAMAKAQELLAKYNLDAHMIQDAVKAAGGTAQETKREKTQVNRSAMYRWQQKFWAGLAEANYCFHWIVETYAKTNKGDNRRVKRHVVLGSEVNVAAVVAMGEYLTEVIERELPYPNTERLSRSAVSWREGCAERLVERVAEKMEAMKQQGVTVEGANCSALAVRDMHEAEYSANYDARYGHGAYARMKKNEAEWEVRAAERREKQAAEEARRLGSETPEQRAQREAQEFKAAAKQAAKDARWWEGHCRRQERQAAKRDVAAYARGSKKANSINLDLQVKE